LLKDNCTLEFMYRHDSHVLPQDHPLATSMLTACDTAGVPATIDAMTASCDSWFYHNQLQIPALVYGAGNLKYAHSNAEQIAVADIRNTAIALTNLLVNY